MVDIEELQLEGWVPFGAYNGARVFAKGDSRFFYFSDSKPGKMISGLSPDVEPREFASSERVLSRLVYMSEALRLNGEVPSILSIPIVSDWGNVLNYNEINIETSEMDKRRKATFNLMPGELKWVLWKAYSCNPERVREYNSGQRKWMQDSAYYLGMKTLCSPSNNDVGFEYISKGVSLEYRINFALRNPDWMEKVYPRLNLNSANLNEPYTLPEINLTCVA